MMPAALILAGSRKEACALAASEGVAHKALITIDGQPLLARVHQALCEAGITRIAVSAESPDVIGLARQLGAEIVLPGMGPSESVARAYGMIGTPLLVTTADHALLRPEWVKDFIADTPDSADVAVLLAQRDAVEAVAPGNHRTWLRFADGEWSGCNLFLIATPRGEQAIAAWRQVEAERKRPWRIAAKLGPRTLWAYLRGKLTLAEAMASLGQRIGLEAAVVTARNGLAALDVDKATDLMDVRRIVSQPQAGLVRIQVAVNI